MQQKLVLVGERAILALTNVAVVLCLARLLDLESFGAFSTILALWFFIDVARTAVLNPLIAWHPQSAFPEYLFGSWFCLTLGVALFLGVPMLGALSIILSPQTYARAVALYAMTITFPFALFYSLRSAFIMQGFLRASLAMSCGLFVFCSIAIALLWAEGVARSLSWACALIAFAHVAAIGLGWSFGSFPVRFSFRHFVGILRRLLQNRAAIASTLVLDGPGLGLFSMVLGSTGGAVETARYVASRTLLRPVGIILNAMEEEDRVLAARSFKGGNTTELRDWYRRARFMPALIMLGPLILVLAFGDDLVTLVYGAKYDNIPVSLWAFLMLVNALVWPQIIFLLTSGHARQLTLAALYSLAFTIILVLGVILMGHATASEFILAETGGRLLLIAFLTREITRVR